VLFQVSGRDAVSLFANESGGHRWQRPSGKKKKIHSSTVTVAVLPKPKAADVTINPNDIEIDTMRGSVKAGGQHQNVTDSAVRIKHIPSGLVVVCQSERDQRRNRESAMSVLRARLVQRLETESKDRRDRTRKRQVGKGQRGDKRRTVSTQNGKVTDHITGKKMDLKSYLRGHIEKLA